ncbi:Small glutamine-rich tetratricopeptide repeat-containing protein alpha [Sugiyamaella lignohabitans]|uniref:Small glutamine-rich tetratricopeptide repeat-containing protein alpha n=1 Tax=Sugiyamaella lignohabitans TaxID=796027 RepID=A0A161HNP8_9ASCO|nr:Small glutamine-rich tetratricopeptide repeat-containing protein alpha [Sugiyamaella lignohabitans]ANB15807.1 Small glutamine-rich tetratricopeptide repeat-containing protein alpha [Sugiyamaella lignohabitans]
MSLPVTVDPATKAISVDASFIDSLGEESQKDLNEKLLQLNDLSRYLTGLSLPVPPAPNTISKQLTDQVNKLRAHGVTQSKAGKHQEALKHFTLAVQLALKRPPWEAALYVIEEVCGLLALRADSYMALNLWPEAYTDASLIVLLVPTDPKGHHRRGRCLQTIGKYSEARVEYLTASAALPQDTSIKESLAEVEALLAKP